MLIIDFYYSYYDNADEELLKSIESSYTTEVGVVRDEMKGPTLNRYNSRASSSYSSSSSSSSDSSDSSRSSSTLSHHSDINITDSKGKGQTPHKLWYHYRSLPCSTLMALGDRYAVVCWLQSLYKGRATLICGTCSCYCTEQANS